MDANFNEVAGADVQMDVAINHNNRDIQSQIWSNEDNGSEVDDDNEVTMEGVGQHYCQEQPNLPKMKMYEEEYVKNLVSEFLIFLINSLVEFVTVSYIASLILS